MEIYQKTSHVYIDDVEAANKRFVFHPTCGGCYRKIRGRGGEKQLGFLCADCKPHKTLYRDDNDVVCNLCQYEYDCTMRVAMGAWTRCETPDAADIKRLQDMEAFDDPELTTILADSLAAGRNRQVLETAVSKIAEKIHQSHTSWRQRQVS